MSVSIPFGKPARVQLGEVIRFHREKRSLPVRRVADMCGVSREAVDNWERGNTVPDGKSWDKLKGMVSHTLSQHAQLYQQAKLEADSERIATIRRREEQNQMSTNKPAPTARPLVQNLGDKLATVIPIAKPSEPVVQSPPTVTIKEGPMPQRLRPQPKRPPGSMSIAGINERFDFARSVLVQRPHIKVAGPDGLIAVIKARFGVGIDNRSASKLVEEHHAKMTEAVQSRGALDAIQREVITKPLELPPTANADEQIKAATSLILEAVPNLASFTISVDASGAASVGYTTRELRVVENTGSFKVQR